MLVMKKSVYLFTVALFGSSCVLAQSTDPGIQNQRRTTSRAVTPVNTLVLSRPGAPLMRDYSKPAVMSMQSPSVNPSLLLSPVQMSNRLISGSSIDYPQQQITGAGQPAPLTGIVNAILPANNAANPAGTPSVAIPGLPVTLPTLPSIVNPILPVVTPIITPVLPIITPVLPGIINPVLPVVTPIVNPVVTPIVNPIVTPVLPIIGPLLPGGLPGLGKPR